MWHSNRIGKVRLFGKESTIIEHITEDLIPGVAIVEIGCGATIQDAIVVCIKLAIEFDMVFTFGFNGYIMNIDKNSMITEKLDAYTAYSYA